MMRMSQCFFFLFFILVYGHIIAIYSTTKNESTNHENYWKNVVVRENASEK